MTEGIDRRFLEKLIIKGILTDKTFLVLVTSAFEKDYFNNSEVAKIFEIVGKHFDEFKNIPQRDIIINNVENGERSNVNEILEEVESIDYDIANNRDHLLSETNNYLKEQAIKNSIVQSVDIVENNGNPQSIKNIIENALCKDLKVDLGLEYFRELGNRLQRIFTTTDVRIPTYYPQFDEFINGGFPPLTLSVIVARIHGFKSNTMANFAARQVLRGKNVALLTLEMSQDMFAQRFDSIYSYLDINRMYLGANRRRLTDKLAETKATENRGELYIKHYPTGVAKVSDFRKYLRELKMRGIELDIIYVDYINLMKPESSGSSDLYNKVKGIAEELRALSFEFELPVVSVSQLNREGSFVGFEELDFNYIAESMGLPATCDFLSIYGLDEDKLIYESEVHYKIVKNRLGGRVGEIGKMYFDSRNLKMYDESEIDQWVEDANISGDERNMAPEPQPQRRSRVRRR